MVATRTEDLYRDINPSQFAAMCTGENIVILDVRTREEFESGRITKAVNLDVNRTSFLEAIDSLDRNKIYLVYCRSGSRSINACVMLGSRGFKAYNLLGGICQFTEENG